MQIQMVTFSEPKDGNAPGEWQDGACGGVLGDGTATPRRARFVVLDGATGAYDPVRWVDQLVRSFAPQAGGAEGPRLEPAAMRAWFAEMQDQWAADVRVFDSIIEERKFAEVGSFATLLGFEIYSLDGPEPYWQAVALGDTVLFHVRAGRMIAVFPPMGPDDFGTLPDGVHTARASLDRMTERLLTGGGALEVGDFLFAATDAMAQWILRTIERVWDRWFDTFSALVIYLSLIALGKEPSLWLALYNSKNLLFAKSDFFPPFKTEAWKQLAAMGDPQVDELVRRLQECCDPDWVSTKSLEMTLDQQAVTPARQPIPAEQRWWEKKPVAVPGSAVPGSAADGPASRPRPRPGRRRLYRQPPPRRQPRPQRRHRPRPRGLRRVRCRPRLRCPRRSAWRVPDRCPN